MQIMVSRLSHHYQGIMVSLKDGDEIKDIALINGNKHDFSGPLLLFSIDQEVIYGLSRHKVISRIYSQGPQILLTTKELGHKLYEHGMKAALGKVKVGNITFTTNLETFYSVSQKYGCFELTYSEGRIACLVKPAANYKPILLATSGYQDKLKIDSKNRIDIDKIQTIVTKSFDLEEVL